MDQPCGLPDTEWDPDQSGWITSSAEDQRSTWRSAHITDGGYTTVNMTMMPGWTALMSVSYQD